MAWRGLPEVREDPGGQEVQLTGDISAGDVEGGLGPLGDGDEDVLVGEPALLLHLRPGGHLGPQYGVLHVLDTLAGVVLSTVNTLEENETSNLSP